MKCLTCHKTTPDTELYCRHCGTKLEFSFEEVTDKLSNEIRSEKMQETEAFFRWIMMIVLLLFTMGYFFNSLWLKTPQPTLTPGYVPDIQLPDRSSEILKPIVIPE